MRTFERVCPNCDESLVKAQFTRAEAEMLAAELALMPTAGKPVLTRLERMLKQRLGRRP